MPSQERHRRSIVVLERHNQNRIKMSAKCREKSYNFIIAELADVKRVLKPSGNLTYMAALFVLGCIALIHPFLCGVRRTVKNLQKNLKMQFSLPQPFVP